MGADGRQGAAGGAGPGYRLLTIGLAMAALYLLEVTASVQWPQAIQTPGPRPQTRLIVFWMDSLDVRDVQAADRMPMLRQRLGSALHGPVRTCTDALSVACFTAMQTGLDRFSIFSAMRNFGRGKQGVPPGSILAELQREGLRLGYIGHDELKSTVTGFDSLEFGQRDVAPDHSAVEQGLDIMERDNIDFMVIHMDRGDTYCHKHGPHSPQYLDELARMDAAVERAWARLRPTDHVVVLGDHGHDDQGRHFAGLDVPTYAAYFGPRFARPAYHPMALTDMSALWARVFGYSYGESPWVQRYFSGAHLQPPAELPPLNTGSVLVSWPTMASVFAACLLIALPRRSWQAAAHTLRQRPLLFAGIFMFCALLLLGATFMQWRPLIYYKGKWFNRAFSLAVTLFGAGLLLPLMARYRQLAPTRAGALASLCALGALLLALPTVYKFGGTHVIETGVLAMLAISMVAAPPTKRWLSSAAMLALLLTLWNPRVKSFKLYTFSFYYKLLGDYQLQVSVALVALALAMCWRLSEGTQRQRWLLGGAAGMALAVAGPWLPPALFAPLCASALPLLLLAHYRPGLDTLAVAVAVPALAFFHGFDGETLAPKCAALALWPLWARAMEGRPPLQRALVGVLLVSLALWTSIGNRISGIDFQYFFAWLPEDARVEQTALQNAILTTSKYLALPVFGLLMARRVSPQAVSAALPLIWQLAALRVAATLVFLVGFSALAAGAGPFVMSDTIQETGIWIVVLMCLCLLPMSTQASAAVATQASVPGSAHSR